MSEIELHCDKNQSKKETDEKKLLFLKKVNLKVIETIRYERKSLTRLSYNS